MNHKYSMRIRYGDIILRKVEASDIERIRYHRNQPHIRQYMEHQEFITPQAQRRWFRTIDNAHHFYFLIEPITHKSHSHHEQHGTAQNKPYGMVHLSPIDYEAQKAWAGLFAFEPHANNLDIWLASYALLRFAFEHLMLKMVWAKVALRNHSAQEYNQSLGFVHSPKPSNQGFATYFTTAQSTQKATHNYTRLIHKRCPEGMQIEEPITYSRSNPNHPSQSQQHICAD